MQKNVFPHLIIYHRVKKLIEHVFDEMLKVKKINKKKIKAVTR